MDLEVADIDDISQPESRLSIKSRNGRLTSLLKPQSLAKEPTNLQLNDALMRVRPIPTLLGDTKLFYCTNNIVAVYSINCK